MFVNLIDVLPGKCTVWGYTIPIGDALEQARVSALLVVGLFMILSSAISAFLFNTSISGIVIVEMLSIPPVFVLYTTARRKSILFISQVFLSTISVLMYGIFTILTLYPLSVALVIVYPFLSLWSLDVTTRFSEMDFPIDKVIHNIFTSLLTPIVYKALGINYEEITAREWAMKNVEDIVLLSAQVARATSNVDRTLALVAFFKYRSKRSLLYGLTRTEFLDYITGLFDSLPEHSDLVSDEVMTAQSLETCVASMDSFTKFWASFRNSELAKRLVKMSSYLLVSGASAYCGITFDRLGYTRFEASAMKKKFSLRSLDFVTTLLETFNFFLNKGYAIYKGAPLDTFMDPLSSYEDWYNEARWLEQKRNFISNAEAAGFKEFEYRMRLDKAIEHGNAIMNFVKRIKSDDKVIVENKLARLKQMRDEMLILDDAAAMRDPPFSILIVSPPNRGKTSIVSIIFNHFGRVCNMPTGPGYIYTRNGVSDFWDGFKTRMWCLFLDDISFRKVDVCKAGGDPSTMEIINAINPAPYVPNQAALEDKGKTPLKSKLVIGTTNTKFLNASQYFTTPSAVMRRFRYIIEVEVKPEYRNPDWSLDYSKTPPVQGYPDLWIYHVERPVLSTVDPNKAATVEVGTFKDRRSFLIWYTSVIRKYEDEVATLKASNYEVDNVVYCPSCVMPEVDCKCVEEVVDRIIDEAIFDLPMTAQTRSRCSSCDYEFKQESSDAYDSMPDTVGDVDSQQQEPGVRSRCSSCDYEFTEDQYNAHPFFNRKAESDKEPQNFEYEPSPFFKYFIYFVDCVRNLIPGFIKIQKGNIKRWQDEQIERDRRENAELKEEIEDCERFVFSSTKDKVDNMKNVARELAAGVCEDVRPALCAMRRLHRKAVASVKRPHLMIVLASIVVALLAAWKVSNSMTAQSGWAPSAHTLERENVWYTSDYDLQTFDTPTDSQSIRLSDMESMMRRAVYFARATANGKHYYQRWLKIKGNYFVTLNHGVPPGPFKLKMKIQPDNSSCNQNFETQISENQVFRDVERDLAVIYVPHASPGKDLSRFILPKGDTFESKGLATLYSRRETGEFVLSSVEQTARNRSVTYRSSIGLHSIDGWRYVLHLSPSYGLCGAPLVLHSPKGFVLAGLHAAAHHNGEIEFTESGKFSASAQLLTKQWLDEALSHFDSHFPYADPSEPMMTANSKAVAILPLHHKSPVRFFQSGELTVYGSLSTGRSRMKSRVEPHLLAEEVKSKFGWEQEFYKPVMTGWEPWRYPLVNFTKPKGKFRTDILKKAADGYLADIKGLVPQHEVDLLHPYDTFTAINGAAGVGYVDSIKRSTSAGFPFNRSKRFYLEPDEATEQAPEPVKPTPEVIERMNIMREKMERREMIHPVFRAHLKDEPVSAKKRDLKKTRVFMGAPMDWTILVREKLLCFVRLVQRNKGAFEAMPGVVCQSKEWDDLLKHLTQFGVEELSDGDHAAFDQSVDPDVANVAWYVILTIMSWSPHFDQKDMNSLHSIAMDMLHVLVDYNGDLIELNGSTPSGFPLTVILNCIINSIYMRYAFIVIRERQEGIAHCYDFRKSVALACYGDDNIFNSSKKWFDTYNISKVLAEVGLEYTTADKTEPKPGHKHIKDCSFLKRSWRFDDDLQCHVAPLEEKSIHKMMTVWVNSKSVTPQVQAAATVFTASIEYFWYGRAKFEEMRTKFLELLIESNLEHYLPAPLPTWEQLKDDFEERSASRIPLFRQ